MDQQKNLNNKLLELLSKKKLTNQQTLQQLDKIIQSYENKLENICSCPSYSKDGKIYIKCSCKKKN